MLSMGAYEVQQGHEAGRDATAVVNTEQAAAWDGHEGDVWTEQADRYDRASRRMWQRFLDAGLVHAADRVLDVGCGTGRPTRDIARVATEGAVTGIDLSTRMLELARSRAADEGLGNVEFVRGDAQVFPFEPASFDVVMSSFGTLFFGDRVEAYTNLGRSLRPGGSLAVLAWRTPDENPWLTGLFDALAMGRDVPTPPPDAPSPFSHADPDRVRAFLGESGFVDVDLRALDAPMDLGVDADDACDFARTMGVVEGLTEGLGDTDRATAMANVAALFRDHETPDGVLFDGAAWLITARRP